MFSYNGVPVGQSDRDQSPGIGDVSDAYSNFSFSLNSLHGESVIGSPIFLNVSVNGIPLNMELDTWAKVSVIPEKIWQKHFVNCEARTCSIRLCIFDGSELPDLGQSVVDIQYENQRFQSSVVIVRGEK